MKTRVHSVDSCSASSLLRRDLVDLRRDIVAQRLELIVRGRADGSGAAGGKATSGDMRDIRRLLRLIGQDRVQLLLHRFQRFALTLRDEVMLEPSHDLVVTLRS